jgi:hypothetical protein
MPNPKPTRPAREWKPQTNLDNRMLAQAVEDLQIRTLKGRRERSQYCEAFESAARWVFIPDASHHFTLARVCERLGREPDRVARDVWAGLDVATRERVRATLYAVPGSSRARVEGMWED